MQNEMRDRLVDLIKECHKKENDIMFGENRPLEFDEWTGIYTDHLIENGVIVLPCKVGETLYVVQIDYEGNYFMTTIIDVSKITMLSILRAYEERTIVYMSTDREKAEKVLKERNNNG
jgi:hypothetical protein